MLLLTVYGVSRIWEFSVDRAAAQCLVQRSRSMEQARL